MSQPKEDLDFIYIVEQEDLERYLDAPKIDYQVMAAPPKKNGNGAEISKTATMLAAMRFVSLPVGLLATAIVASPVISNLFASSSDKSEASEQLKNESLVACGNFLRRYAMTVDMAHAYGAKFPPGHPQIGKMYKLHPLAHVRDAKKEELYVPEENYEAMLLAEREAELLKLLVHLGATRICITKKSDTQTESQLHVQANVGVQEAAEVEVGVKRADTRLASRFDTRVFELPGAPWKTGQILDRSKFSWVGFEPSWNAMIEAREVAGCTKAMLEMRESSSYSSSRDYVAGIKAQIYAAQGSVSTNQNSSRDLFYLIEVEFAPPTTS